MEKNKLKGNALVFASVRVGLPIELCNVEMRKLLASKVPRPNTDWSSTFRSDGDDTNCFVITVSTNTSMVAKHVRYDQLKMDRLLHACQMSREMAEKLWDEKRGMCVLTLGWNLE